MRKKLVSLTFVSCIILTSIFSSFTSKVFASEFNFSVETVLPENQRDAAKTYFDLRMNPSQTQELEITLCNDTTEDVKINPEIHSATTNSNGVVEYGNTQNQKDSSLLYQMEDLVTTEKEVVIPAKGTYPLKLHVKMPDEPFDGIIAGGITLQEANDTGKSKDKGLSITNKYAYVVAMVFNENDNVVTPQLKLNKVFPDQANARNVIKANIQNVMPIYMNQISIDAKIMKKGSEEVVYQFNKDGMQMAPNSNFDLPISLNGEKMLAGEYTLALTASSKGEIWNWRKDFKIDDQSAKKLNETDVSITKDSTWLYVALGLLLVCSSFGIFFLWNRKKKRNQMNP
ncbi:MULTISPECIES: DUF916 and DUF3324 domain-containing protein [Bacillus cereus group]|uniref:DUF916 and DUF3324 domain-containing protein n=1 Tax=Bacillus cereus group TaxID=86661 RepID=UPI000279E69D|nr:DUF916 and DUF3324 domain-containing protein [Bacillus cereus]EJR28605.1 hypothetical protein IIE_05250 [Bacillus cereus VD045]HDR4351248.1 DUF916 and DUF3324 domain-containing protein [Bacillus cereus]HDR6958336.1 DUF916 and DUF3324 domain-containing protein [Bacillus cereus]